MSALRIYITSRSADFSNKTEVTEATFSLLNPLQFLLGYDISLRISEFLYICMPIPVKL